MRGPYFWLVMTRLYTQWLQAFQRKDRFSYYQKLTSLSAFGSILKIFGGNRVGKCEGRTFGWIWQDYVHDWYGRTNEKLDSHITENLTSLSAFGSISKIFGNRCRLMWGRTFGWVRQDYAHTYQRKGRLSHYQNSTSLSAFGSILKDFFFFGNRCRLMRGSYFWLGTTRLYTQWLQASQRKDRFSHYQKLTSLSAFGFILKDFFFFGNRCW